MNGLYRGKRKDNGELMVGFLEWERDDDCVLHHFIHTGYDGKEFEEWYTIEPSSIAAYTGRKDKNGDMIFGCIEIDGVMTEGGDALVTSNNNPEFDTWTADDFGPTKIRWDKDCDGFAGDNWTWDNGNSESVYDLQFIEIIKPEGSKK